MFKRFSREQISSQSNIKSSAQRALRTRLVSQFPALEELELLDLAIPKKAQLTQLKCPDKWSIFCTEGRIVIAQHSDDPIVPTLRLIHSLPKEAFPWVQVDRGAIKFVLGGANIMCPGLTSAGADMPQDYEEGQLVAIYAQGKEHALAVGRLDMSTKEIREKNKGVGVTVIMHLGDGLWNLGPEI